MSICEDWGSNEDEKRPLNLSAMSREQLARIAIFIGGTGDARHLFGSILGLGRIHQSLEKKKKKAKGSNVLYVCRCSSDEYARRR